MRKAQPKYIPWETVQVGDTIRATTVMKDCKITVEGVVSDIDYQGYARRYFSEHNVKFFTQTVDGRMPVQIELINRPQPINEMETLF